VVSLLLSYCVPVFRVTSGYFIKLIVVGDFWFFPLSNAIAGALEQFNSTTESTPFTPFTPKNGKKGSLKNTPTAKKMRSTALMKRGSDGAKSTPLAGIAGMSGDFSVGGSFSIMGSDEEDEETITMNQNMQNAQFRKEQAIKQQRLLGLFAQRKQEQDAIAEELRKASAAIRIKGTMETTISDLSNRLDVEKAAREAMQKEISTTGNDLLQASVKKQQDLDVERYRNRSLERQIETLQEHLATERWVVVGV
jgi:hypothetical protein